jgi:hypothetical protein
VCITIRGTSKRETNDAVHFLSTVHTFKDFSVNCHHKRGHFYA